VAWPLLASPDMFFRTPDLRAAPLLLALCAPVGAAAQGSAPEPPSPQSVGVSGTSAPQESRSTELTPGAPSELADCNAKAGLSVGDRLYLPCGKAGVIAVRVGASGERRVETLYATSGSVEGLFLRGDEVWVDVQRREAQPLSQMTPTLAPSTVGGAGTSVAPSLALAAPVDGSVRAVKDDEVTVSFGSRQGLRNGAHVELFERLPVPGGGEREISLAVGEVVEVSSEVAQVRLGMGEAVPARALARATTRARTESIAAPPRFGGITIVEGGVRPHLTVGALGVAVLSDFAVTYLGESCYFARLELKPLGGIWSAKTTTGVFAGHALLGYDHQFFALGAGIGVVRAARGEWREDGRNSDAYNISADMGAALSVKQMARLGSRDGLFLSVDNAFVLGGRRWHYAFVDIAVQIPLGKGRWLALDGSGGGLARFMQVGLGLRRLVYGTGGPRSLFLRPSVGLAAVSRAKYVESDFYYGPMVGLHAEWRQ
jgi:hypothetical protein